MLVTSIDVGIQHLGLVKVETNDANRIRKIVEFALVDIQTFHPAGTTAEDCPLRHHDRCFADWVAHVLINYSSYFDETDVILIERQPPCGLVAIEQLIFAKFRDKAQLVSPNAVHCHFKVNHCDYEKRKEHSMRRFSKAIEQNLSLREKYKALERRHDIADAFVQLEFYLFKRRQRDHREQLAHQRKERRLDMLSRNMTLKDGSEMKWEEFFKRCEYHPGHR
jgi:hypothetical protein